MRLALVEFGLLASSGIVSQKEAITAMNGFDLSGHGGTHEWIIGAAAGGGLTISEWSGSYMEFNGFRSFPETVILRVQLSRSVTAHHRAFPCQPIIRWRES